MQTHEAPEYKKERDDRGVGEHNTFDEIQYSRKVRYIIVRMQESAIIKVNFHCDLIESVLKNTALRPLLKFCLITKIFT